MGPSWPVSTERVWGELNLSPSKMADGSDREVTQNDINSQWSLFFTDLDELLSEYEQHRSTNDIAITENLTIRLVPDNWGPAILQTALAKASCAEI